MVAATIASPSRHWGFQVLALLVFEIAGVLTRHLGPDCGVIAHGARCDGRADDTRSVQAALDACGYKGVVQLPPGRTCLTFPLRFPNGTQLHVPAHTTLKAFPNVSAWPNKTCVAPLPSPFVACIVLLSAFHAAARRQDV